jgi:Armadillo/beta-catenin-like repeat
LTLGQRIRFVGQNQIAIAAAGAIGPLVALLRVPADDVKTQAATALWNLATNGTRMLPSSFAAPGP